MSAVVELFQPGKTLTVASDLIANHGIPVFHCHPNKQPMTDHGFHDASMDLDGVESWFRESPHALVAVPTGAASKLLVIDIDPDGADWYRQNSDRLACARVHKTRRGHHLLYRMPDADIRCSTSKVAPGVDVRANGGYIIWWPAHGLEAIGDLNDVSAAPEWLLEKLRPTEQPLPANGARARSEDTADKSAPRVVVDGSRNDYLSREAFRLRKKGSTVDQIIPVLLAMNATQCEPPLEDAEVHQIALGKAGIEPEAPAAITADDFYAYMPMHQYIFVPSRELWPPSSVNARVEAPSMVNGKTVKASDWLDAYQPVDQMTWAPGRPMLIRDHLVSGGGWIERAGCAVFNLYREPAQVLGDAGQAGRWLNHVRRVYPQEADHIIQWLAHRVQRPGEKINHALVLGSLQGTGKDTLLEPVKYAVGPWNFSEVAPSHLLGRFNSFVKSVILRVSEARDLGDVDRYAFYDHMKTYTAAPPDVLRCDEKNIREYTVMNVCGVIITTNHKSDGIYLPSDDRRHFVAWSDLTKEDFEPEYWNQLWSWYQSGGIGHVCAYLKGLDLSQFDPKAPPPKTTAFWDIVDANRAPEDAELADALDAMGHPDALTLITVAAHATEQFREWLQDRRNRRQIPHRLEAAGYVAVRSETATDGLWKIACKRQAVYAKRSLAARDRISAANDLGRSW